MKPTLLISALALPSVALALVIAGSPARGATTEFTSQLIAPTAAVLTDTTTTVKVRIKCTSGTVSRGIVDIELYNSADAMEKQQYWEMQGFKLNQTREYSFSWSRATAGTITARVGVFTRSWGQQLHWNHNAGTITFEGSSVASTPAAPGGLSATAANAQVALTWTASAGATSYRVKRSTTSGSGYATIASPTGTSFTDSGVTNGVTYYYVVSAVNDGGESANSSQVSATPTAPSGPAGLPPFLGLGLANAPNNISWMTGSGTPWTYRYQYLCGGVNTNEGWTTWNSPAGQFATLYMDNSRKNGYIPVLTYYQLVHSNPNPYDENLAPKLQSASTMNAYFAEWKLLMQRCSAFGGTVLVHVEPDAWGYIQQSKGDNPVNYAVSVASSGFSEVAAFENNARGFARALVALRDSYAPNVLLAWHASHWATGVDLCVNNGDPVTIGTRTANFFKSLNANFDLIFYDPSDRDAGFYQYVWGDGGSHWWDAADFSRFRTFLATITSSTGRKGMLWQLPIGNTLYRSCNNTWNHYQDNRAQFFLQEGNRQNLVDWANAGLIGILFGRGASGPTNYLDSAGDGITNPSPINGNNLVASYADDDGGFLRLRAADYYLNGKVTLP